MIKNILKSSIIVGLSLTPAFAEQAPVGIDSDVRIKEYVYDENEVYKLQLNLKSVTTIQFGEEELVESILLGDSVSWEVEKLNRGNIISVKPITDATMTNMTIYTDKRVYTFALTAVGKIEAADAETDALTFRTKFTYPEEVVEQAVLDKSVVSKENVEPVEFDEKAVVGGPEDHNYLVSGQGAFKPQSVYDNTMQTTFTMPKGSPRPAIYKVGANNEEKLVNSRNKGDQIIVDGTSDYWVLRIGDEAICVGRAAAIHG